MKCPRCAGHDVGRIAFSVVKAGITFHYCRYCENRWWESAEGAHQLPEVLRAASVLARAS